jgi:hypothetical protein
MQRPHNTITIHSAKSRGGTLYSVYVTCVGSGLFHGDSQAPSGNEAHTLDINNVFASNFAEGGKRSRGHTFAHGEILEWMNKNPGRLFDLRKFIEGKIAEHWHRDNPPRARPLLPFSAS